MIGLSCLQMVGKNADTPMLYDGCRNSHAHAFPEAWREEDEEKVGYWLSLPSTPIIQSFPPFGSRWRWRLSFLHMWSVTSTEARNETLATSPPVFLSGVETLGCQVRITPTSEPPTSILQLLVESVGLFPSGKCSPNGGKKLSVNQI